MEPVPGPVAPAEPPAELNLALADAKTLACEQVAAAWQLHLDRVREQLEAGWRESLDEIFEQRFDEIASRLQEGFEQAVAARAHTEAERSSSFLCAEARRGVTESLNASVRRLKQAESEALLFETLLDSAGSFCGRAALFLLDGGQMRLHGNDVSIPLDAAPAFAAAADSRDTVVASGTPRELSQTVAGLLGGTSPLKVYLFPVVVHHKSVAVLYAEPQPGGDIDVSALELLTAFAAASIDVPEPAPPPPANLVRIEGTVERPAARPAWAELSRPEQESHLRAQRFARTRIAEIVLRRMPAVREGRAVRELYRTLKEEIDAGRDAFRRQFIETCPSMVDYYHVELVRTLAKEDTAVLGPDYPGPQR